MLVCVRLTILLDYYLNVWKCERKRTTQKEKENIKENTGGQQKEENDEENVKSLPDKNSRFFQLILLLQKKFCFNYRTHWVTFVALSLSHGIHPIKNLFSFVLSLVHTGKWVVFFCIDEFARKLKVKMTNSDSMRE